VKALIWSAIIDGVAAVPIMAMIMLIASRKSVMGEFALTKRLAVLGWLATGCYGGSGGWDVCDVGKLSRSVKMGRTRLPRSRQSRREW
jgi:Mn2+/Fe2+ NRAMP family transporter